MRSAATAALITGTVLTLASACGTASATPKAWHHAATPTVEYLGAVTTGYRTEEGSVYVSPPAGKRPTISWQQAYRQVCSPATNDCKGEDVQLVLAAVNVKGAKAAPLPTTNSNYYHRLMYVVTVTGIRCNSIIHAAYPGTFPPPSGAPTPSPQPQPTWCQSHNFVAADGRVGAFGDNEPMPNTAP